MYRNCFIIAVLLAFAPAIAAEEKVKTKRLADGAVQPRVATDGDGNAHVVYFKGKANGGDLYYSRVTADGNLSQPIRVNAAASSVVIAGGMRQPGIAVSGSGRVHIAWFAKSDGHAIPFMYTRLSSDGDSFETPRNIVRKTEHLDGGGAIAADANNNVYVVWHAVMKGEKATEQNRKIVIAKSSDDGATFAAEAAVETPVSGACGCCGLAANIGGDGHLHILYRNAASPSDRHMQWLVSKDGGKTFASKTVHEWNISTCPASSARISPVSKGVVLAWETKQQAMALLADANGVHEISSATVLGSASAKHPAAAANSRGEVLLAWIETSGFGREGQLRWARYESPDAPLPIASDALPDAPVWASPAIIVLPDATFLILY